MTGITLLRGLLACLVLAWVPAAQAQEAAPPADDYAEAMRLIAAERHAEAAALLARIVASTPEHAGALLDLAIVQCTLGHAATAARLLDALTARFAPPPAIAGVVAALRARGCAPAPAQGEAGAWTLALARGTDSNASQGASVDTLVLDGLGGTRVELPLAPEYLPRGDRFTLLAAEYARDWAPGALPGGRGFAQLQARVHDALGQYDTIVVQAGAELPWRFGAWRGRVAGGAGALLLGGRLYQRHARLQWQGTPPLLLPAGMRLSATAELAQVRYPGLANFDATTGEAGGLLEWRAAAALLRVALTAAADRAADARPGGDRRGWQAAVQVRLPAWGGGHGELAASRRVWHGEKAYAPGLIDRQRVQTTDSVSAVWSVPLAPQQALFVELRATNNRESIPVFGHASRQLLLGWEWRGR